MFHSLALLPQALCQWSSSHRRHWIYVGLSTNSSPFSLSVQHSSAIPSWASSPWRDRHLWGPYRSRSWGEDTGTVQGLAQRCGSMFWSGDRNGKYEHGVVSLSPLYNHRWIALTPSFCPHTHLHCSDLLLLLGEERIQEKSDPIARFISTSKLLKVPFNDVLCIHQVIIIKLEF